MEVIRWAFLRWAMRGVVDRCLVSIFVIALHGSSFSLMKIPKFLNGNVWSRISKSDQTKEDIFRVVKLNLEELSPAYWLMKSWGWTVRPLGERRRIDWIRWCLSGRTVRPLGERSRNDRRYSNCQGVFTFPNQERTRFSRFSTANSNLGSSVHPSQI